jgi:acyl-CoA reductase-like NAD-dependent aldehyde dehydrogenase
MLEVRDPADTRSVVAEVPAMTAAEVAAAYDRARTAFEGWRRANPLDRAAVLARAADLIRSRTEEGAVILVRENGKTLAEARVEVTKTADFLDYYASFARQPWGELLSDARPGTSTSVRVEPVGVVLAICPWNDPLITPARKLGPALIGGNTVVLPDADLDMTAATLVSAAFAQAGQRCTATSRLIVDVSVAAALESRLRDAVAGIVVGPVLGVTTASGFDDAVRLANDTVYGLSAAVFTTSLTSANKFIELAEAGQVAVNLPTAGWDVHHPFGGFRESGSAFKEQGAPGLRFYTRLKTAAVRFAW